MFNLISSHFQSEGIPEKLADYMSHNLTIQIHQSAVELANILREEFGEPQADYICEDCLERELHEQMVDDIAKASDLPPELVQRVLDGQAEVLGMDD